jgi:Holliday junction resolvasome RuvABC ATP-dependent DNA helicase subunit
MGHVLIQYVFLAVGLMATLGLFVSVKRELRIAAVKNRQRLEALAARVSGFQTVDAEHLNKRVTAMRMVRRNEDISTIAAALGMTRQEVELLIRVQGVGRAKAARAGK